MDRNSFTYSSSAATLLYIHIKIWIETVFFQVFYTLFTLYVHIKIWIETVHAAQRRAIGSLYVHIKIGIEMFIIMVCNTTCQHLISENYLMRRRQLCQSNWHK